MHAVGSSLPLLEHSVAASYLIGPFLPSGVAFGVGMYITPDWTIPRALVRHTCSAHPP